eukprot:1214680-Rhodomonas_salina.1
MGDEDEDMGELVEDEDQGQAATGPGGRRPQGRARREANARWDAAGGGMADGYVVTQIPGVDGAIGSKDQ